MRHSLFIIIFFLVTACHNKNDLKRIDALEKENKQLKEKFNNGLFESAKRDIVDSIVFGITSRDKMLELFFDQYRAINTLSGKFIKLGKEHYQTDIHFVVDRNLDFDSILYMTPVKNRSVLDWKKYYHYNNNFDGMQRSGKNFTYAPKDTGWYYYFSAIQIKNKRVGSVTSYPIIDSFYVYK